jgi:hypothetical protein
MDAVEGIYIYIYIYIHLTQVPKHTTIVYHSSLIKNYQAIFNFDKDYDDIPKLDIQ